MSPDLEEHYSMFIKIVLAIKEREKKVKKGDEGIRNKISS